MSEPGLSLIVLAYDDAPSLEVLLPALHKSLAELGLPFEILVVDDGSHDRTAELVSLLSRRLPALRLLRHERNRGVGAAFRTGVAAARGELVAYTDGDGQYDPADLRVLLAALEGADAASGVRTTRADPAYRLIVSRVYRLMLRLLYGVRLRDANSGLKVYRRSFLDAALPIVSDGPFYDAEVLIKGVRAGGRVAEVPIRHLPRLYGRARGVSWPSLRRGLAGVAHPAMQPYLRRGPLAPAARRLIHALLHERPAG